MRFTLSHVRRTLVSGLLLLLPVGLTYVIIKFLFDLVDGLLRPAMQWFLGRLGVEWTLPGPGLVAAVLLIYFVGLFTAFGLGKRTAAAAEGLLLRIPFIGMIYSTNHQLVESFSGANTTGFQRVVLVEFPRDNTWSLGFLTGLCETEGISTHIMAYVPTAPLPNSGFVIFLPPESVLDTDMSVPEAMQFVFSGGVVSPTSLKTRKINIEELEKTLNAPQPTTPSLTDTVKETLLGKATEAGRATRRSAKKLKGSLPSKTLLMKPGHGETDLEQPEDEFRPVIGAAAGNMDDKAPVLPTAMGENITEPNPDRETVGIGAND